jgi:hypothetical protein
LRRFAAYFSLDVMILHNFNSDPQFTDIAKCVLKRSVELYYPKDVFVVYVDNWFDVKWLGFSGKVLGALGVWKKNLTVPPFVPNRAQLESHFTLDAARRDYIKQDVESVFAARLHRKQLSSDNLSRRIRHISDSAIFFWFSKASAESGRGSMMLYRVRNGETSSWYASFHRAPEWKLLHTRNISRTELLHLTQTSNQVLERTADRT